MTTVSLTEAQSKLPELVHQLTPGQEVMITENNQPIARLLPAHSTKPHRTFGTLHGTVVHMASDFDAPLDDFGEYMP